MTKPEQGKQRIITALLSSTYCYRCHTCAHSFIEHNSFDEFWNDGRSISLVCPECGEVLTISPKALGLKEEDL